MSQSEENLKLAIQAAALADNYLLAEELAFGTDLCRRCAVAYKHPDERIKLTELGRFDSWAWVCVKCAYYLQHLRQVHTWNKL